MSGININLKKRVVQLSKKSVEVPKTVPVDSTKPDTTKALSVLPEKTKAEMVVIPEEPDSVSVSGTETLPVTVDSTEATVPASTTSPAPTITANSNGTTGTPSGSGSTSNSNSSDGFDDEPGLTEEEKRMLISIRDSDTEAGSILRDSTQGTTTDQLNSAISAGTSITSDGGIFNDLANAYKNLTNYTIPGIGTLSITPGWQGNGKDCAKNAGGYITGKIRF